MKGVVVIKTCTCEKKPNSTIAVLESSNSGKIPAKLKPAMAAALPQNVVRLNSCQLRFSRIAVVVGLMRVS